MPPIPPFRGPSIPTIDLLFGFSSFWGCILTANWASVVNAIIISSSAGYGFSVLTLVINACLESPPPEARRGRFDFWNRLLCQKVEVVCSWLSFFFGGEGVCLMGARWYVVELMKRTHNKKHWFFAYTQGHAFCFKKPIREKILRFAILQKPHFFSFNLHRQVFFSIPEVG